MVAALARNQRPRY